MKKIVFIGNRPQVLNSIINNNKVEIIKALVIEQPLIKDTCHFEMTRLNAKGDKKKLIQILNDLEFDICVSAGCSYILPLTELPNNKLYINCHPSALPYGKGRHPLNECFLSGNNIAGVTIHLLIDELDAGDILNQVKFELTDEVDVSVLYGFIFDLEAELLTKTLNELIDNDMRYDAIAQEGKETYYSREVEIRVYDAKIVTLYELLNNTRAFSSSNLGVKLILGNLKIIIYNIQEIKNEFILNRYKNNSNGSLLFKNDDVMLVKLIDGIVKINKFVVL